jgi:hypothetical protein
MRLLARFIAVLLVVPALTGCITSETLIRLNADRSGTVEQFILVNVKTLEELPRMMGEMMGGDVKSSSSSSSSSKGVQDLDLFDEAALRAGATKLGPGVRFVSTEQVTRGDMRGAKVIYAFDDVSALTIQPDPPMEAFGDGPSKGAAGEALDLALTRLPNGNALLTVRFDEAGGSKKKAAAPGKAPKGATPPGMEEMMRQMFDGFRVAIDVEVNGRVVNTSSPFVDGSRVTVLEMDLGQLVRDDANLKLLEKLDPGAGVAEMMPLLKDVKGIKVNQSPLTIEFASR